MTASRNLCPVMIAALVVGCSQSEPSPRPVRAPGAASTREYVKSDRPVVDPEPESEPAPPPSPHTYLLLYAAHLAPAAEAWAEYRSADGWMVTPVPVPAQEIASEPTGVGTAELHELILRHHQDHQSRGGESFAVLLLGDAGANGIPTWSFAQNDPDLVSGGDRTYISDHPYQCIDDGDAAPDIALGRIPARTLADAEIALRKVKRYEQSPPGVWRRQINYAAGEGRFGALDLLIEMMFMSMVQQQVPAAYNLSMTYAKATSVYCPSPPTLTDTILQRLGEGSLFFNYVGHGHALGFDRLSLPGKSVPLLQIEDLDRLAGPDDRLPIALLTCCSAGWFDLPGGQRCLAEAMLFHEAGPVAVIAGSRPTHPYANCVLQKDFTQLLLVDQVRTLGDLDLLATRSMLHVDAADRELDAIARPIAAMGRWNSSLTQLRQMHVHLYNLLGDPALRIARPDHDVIGLALNDRTISGYVPEIVEGSVQVTVETSSTTLADPQSIQPVAGPADPRLTEKTAHNYPLANQRTLVRAEGVVREGRFEITLDQSPPATAAVIKVYAVGTNEAAEMVDAFGAVEIERRGDRAGSGPFPDSPQEAP